MEYITSSGMSLAMEGMKKYVDKNVANSDKIDKYSWDMLKNKLDSDEKFSIDIIFIYGTLPDELKGINIKEKYDKGILYFIDDTSTNVANEIHYNYLSNSGNLFEIIYDKDVKKFSSVKSIVYNTVITLTDPEPMTIVQAIDQFYLSNINVRPTVKITRSSGAYEIILLPYARLTTADTRGGRAYLGTAIISGSISCHYNVQLGSSGYLVIIEGAYYSNSFKPKGIPGVVPPSSTSTDLQAASAKATYNAIEAAKTLGLTEKASNQVVSISTVDESGVPTSYSTISPITDAALEDMLTETLGSYTIKQNASTLILNSSTQDSTKQFEITIDDTGTITAQEL